MCEWVTVFLIKNWFNLDLMILYMKFIVEIAKFPNADSDYGTDFPVAAIRKWLNLHEVDLMKIGDEIVVKNQSDEIMI